MAELEHAAEFKDLLLSDLEHFGESLWRNEEIGEKRFNFFLTLVAAVVSALVALHTAAEPKIDDSVESALTKGALASLLFIGLLTYLRLLHRNRVSDQYQRTLSHIRGKLINLSQCGYKVPQPLDAGKWKWFRGGLAETVGAIDAVLLFSLLIWCSCDRCLAMVLSLLCLAVTWGLAAPRKGIQ